MSAISLKMHMKKLIILMSIITCPAFADGVLSEDHQCVLEEYDDQAMRELARTSMRSALRAACFARDASSLRANWSNPGAWIES